MLTAERTGSELALLNFIRHAAGKGWQMAVACETAGELFRHMPAGVETFTWGHGTLGLRRRAYESVLRSALKTDDVLSVAAIQKKFRPEAWYVNTCLQPQIVRQAQRSGIPCVLHTHELERMLVHVKAEDAKAMAEYPALVISGSAIAADTFRTLGRTAAMEVCYENIDSRTIKYSEARAQEIRRSLNVGPGTFIWAMSGTLDPNKNPVRFVEIASQMLRDNLDVHFIWLGGGQSGYGLYAREKAEALGVGGKVTWLGERAGEDYYNHLLAADGLMLTSYQESFSIVSVEAAYLGKPVVSFDCGGVKEIVGTGMGVVIDSWNNSDLIAALARVMRGEINFSPQRARERVKEFDIDVQGPRWEELVRKHLAGKGATVLA